jgi:hypothetical protein
MEGRVLRMFATSAGHRNSDFPNLWGMTSEVVRAVFFRLLTNRHVVIFSLLCPGGIAQLVERLVRNEKARGSNPLTSRLRFGAEKRRLSSRSNAEANHILGKASPCLKGYGLASRPERLDRPEF